MNREKCVRLRNELNALLSEWGAKHGLEARTTGTAHFTTANVTYKIEVAEIKEGITLSKEVTDYTYWAPRVGLPERVGRRFVSAGVLYSITGYVRRRSKFPVCGERVSDGKRFKFPLQRVKGGLLPASEKESLEMAAAKGDIVAVQMLKDWEIDHE